MEQMKLETKNITDENIKKILELFPNVATEALSEDGKLKTAIDFEKLKQELSEVAIDGEECYDFTWVGKKEAMVEANRPIRKTLRPDRDSSVDWENTQNIYIEGDNLDALKLLQESYLGKIKMIYIDPPYNTGKDFVYKDNFTQDKDSYNEELGLNDEEGNRLFQNTESNGRFHSDWCSMIYSRLKLARNLLTDDGVIFISIDDNEVTNLKKICDEIFGEENCIANFTWVKKKKGSHLSKTTRSMTEYVLAFAKNINLIELYGENAYSDKLQPLAKRTNTLKKLIFPANIVKTTLENKYYSKGFYGEGTSGINFKEDFYSENGIIKTSIIAEGPFVWTQAKLDEEIAFGTTIYLSSKFGFNVLRANQESKIKRPSTLIDSKVNVGTNEDAYNELINLFHREGIMSYPKPISLLTYLVNTITYFNKNSIVLDFFSGSATTAHACMQLNAEDGGNRKFIMVQIPQTCDEKSEAYKAGYKNICEIGEERIRRAGKKIQEENPDKKIDVGFRVFKVDTTNMKDVYYTPSELKQGQLNYLETNIKDDRTDEDLLYGCLLDWGVELSLPHRVEIIDGKRVHIVDEDTLVACFEENIPESVIRKIASMKPLRVVFRDSSFSNDDNKINVEEIFKLITSDTRVKVI